MSKIFDPKKKNKLESPGRYKSLPPEETLKKCGLRINDIIADIGSGTGFFSIPASKIVGPGGKVYAIDISPEMLDIIKEKITENSINNIETIQSSPYDFKVEDTSVTFGLAVFVVHEVDDHKRFLKEINRILKKGGKAVILEWQKKEMQQGPPLHHRIDSSFVMECLKESGFTDIISSEISDALYIVQGTKE